MIIDFQYRNHISYAVERDASQRLLGDPVDGSDDDFGADAAEVRRMIELSGMVGPECGVPEDA